VGYRSTYSVKQFLIFLVATARAQSSLIRLDRHTFYARGGSRFFFILGFFCRRWGYKIKAAGLIYFAIVFSIGLARVECNTLRVIREHKILYERNNNNILPI